MSDQTYNGWTNYETWAVGMFLDGNYTGEGTYRDVLELVESAANGNAAERGEALWAVETDLKEYVEREIRGDDAEMHPASLATDLLGAALDSVNWRELAESKLSEIVENAQ